EEKPEAYPEGPICVFDPHVDLYLEPTAEQASKYDVILNVASEVRNPFLTYNTPDPTKEGIRIDEYIHIPWEHNTDIVADLHRLVKLIDDRVRLGKRILIHCQCGVSRSATLVVAYCMYIHPEFSVQQAYDTVKKRSKWIGPNMNLIMQLQEFSSLL
ncbi:DSPc-domain-containing protein, partial [Myriangium duriaei CBS 260.36]